MRRAGLLLALLLVGPGLATRPAGAAAVPHVYLVVVDGLGEGAATPARIPVLHRTDARWLRGRAAMPTRTNPNHASLLTAADARAHGITGNAFWSRRPGTPPASMKDPSLLEVETLFTVAETDDPGRHTVAIFAKPKLERLFSAVPGRQRAPDVLWGPAADFADRDPVTGYGRDPGVMRVLLDAMADREPDLAVVQLADVDRVSHGAGPHAPEAHAAIRGAGEAIEALVEALVARGWWERSIVIVTADHGFDAVAPTAAIPRPAVALDGVAARAGLGAGQVVADGGVAHVYAADVTGDETALGRETAARLAEVADALAATPGVAVVYARLPVPGVAPFPPEWRLTHPRAGELLAVAAAGHQLVASAAGPHLRGNHGGPGEIPIPTVVLGGHPAVARVATDATPGPEDVGASVAALRGLRDGRALGPAPVPGDQRGRAFVAAVDDLRGRTAGSSSRTPAR